MADLTVLAVIKLMIMVFIQYKIVQKLANLVITFFFAQPLPPGPRRLPIIGNVLQIPKSHVFLRWREWSNVYGPVIYLNVLGVRIVALHTVKAAQDLLARRGAKYSDRPRLFLAGELACKDMQLLLMPYDERFKLHQKLMTPVLSRTSSASYEPLADLESRQLLFSALSEANSPHRSSAVDISHHLERTVASITYSLVFASRLLTAREPAILRAREPAILRARAIQSDFAELLVGPNAVDLFPALDRVPILRRGWRRRAERHWEGQLDFHVGNLRAALARPGWSLAREMSRANDAAGAMISEAELAFDLGTIADAAMDTTVVSLDWFVVAWLTQDGGREDGFVARARRELDAVVERDRLPCFEDRPRLPFIDAVVEEVLRWRPIAPSGMPHVSPHEDDVYEGLRIPARSLVSANLWAIGRDPAVFGDDGEAFRPERWLVDGRAHGDGDGDEEKTTALRDLPTIGFGFGRRACPGRHLARNAMWIQVARLLWAFDVVGAVSKEDARVSVEVDPSPRAAVDSLVIRPRPFDVVLRPRGPWVEDVILKTCDTRDEDFVGLLDRIGADRAARQTSRAATAGKADD